jgi:transcriptional regulatory protein LevR
MKLGDHIEEMIRLITYVLFATELWLDYDKNNNLALSRHFFGFLSRGEG